MTAWEAWATGTLAGVGAPLNAITADVLWAWSGAESLPRDRMSWCNPLNTTQVLDRGEADMNTVGVKRYLAVQDGIDATVITLRNGHYPVILANLRNSVTRAKWGNACPNLGTWGTGCGWLSTNYGLVPDNFGGSMADLDRIQTVVEALAGQFFPVLGSTPVIKNELDAILAEVKKPEPAEVEPSGGSATDIAPILAAIAALKLDVDALHQKLDAAGKAL